MLKNLESIGKLVREGADCISQVLHEIAFFIWRQFLVCKALETASDIAHIS